MGLDPEADRAVRGLWSRLQRLGVPSLESHVPGIRPHLSLIVTVPLIVTDDADGLRAHAPRLALDGVETQIEMAAVALFPADPPVLVLAVASAPELVALHARVSGALVAAGIDIWPHYQPGTWLPHCTLSMGVPVDALSDAVATCLASPLPLRARLRDAALTDSVTGATTPL
jgi:2'-5' RNA ligase